MHSFATRSTLERCDRRRRSRRRADAEVDVADCVIDADAAGRTSPTRRRTAALAPAAHLTLEACTVLGKVHAEAARRVRTRCPARRPRRRPTLAGAGAGRAPAGGLHPLLLRPAGLAHAAALPLRPASDPRARPHFTSLRYGDPAYCQLRRSTPAAIRTGADDESEMGVTHELYAPQREANLRIRLDEYLRFGLEAGIFYATDEPRRGR